MSVEQFIAKETQLILHVAKEAIQKILAGNDITHEEHMSIIEMGMSHLHLKKLQTMYRSKTLLVPTF